MVEVSIVVPAAPPRAGPGRLRGTWHCWQVLGRNVFDAQELEGQLRAPMG